MADKTMKTLTIGGNTYEIVDELARTNIEILKEDYVPVTRTVNGKTLNTNIELFASDVGALSQDTKIPVVDSTLSINGAAADAKTTGDNFNSLEQAINNITPESIGAADAEHDHSYIEAVNKNIVLPTTSNWHSMAYGDGTFVAIAKNSNQVVYSKDGFVWNSATLPFTVSNLFASIAYGNGKFVVISYGGNNDKAAYSTDGSVWEQTTLPHSLCVSVIFAQNKFVGVCTNSHTIVQSTDGITWTSLDSNIGDNQSRDVAYGSGKFVAVSNTDKVFYSTDLSTWASAQLSVDAGNRCITYGKGKFVTLAEDSQYAHYSVDGVTWHQTTLPTSDAWSDVVFGNGKFIAIASNSGNVIYSNDGITWDELTLPAPVNSISSNVACWSSVAYGGNRFVITGYNTTDVVYSTDGITWTKEYTVLQQGGESVDRTDIASSGITYSENEQLTGNTWINGKPIYTKMFAKIGVAGNTAFEVYMPENVEMAWLDTANSFHVNYNNVIYAPNCLINNVNYFTCYMSTTNVIAKTNASTGGDFYISVFYTKTTD